MPPLVPLQQTVFEEGPKTSVGGGATPVIQYQEDPTIIPNPINPAVAIDNGVNWYALGAYSFQTAGKMFEETLDYIIDGKDASIQSIGYDLQDETEDLYQEFQIRLRKAEIEGIELTDEDQLSLNNKYEGIKGKYEKAAIGVLGEDDYNLFTKDELSFANIGSKYRRLALQTRKSYYDIENSITKVMYNMASAQQNLIEKNESRARFAAGNGPTGSRQPSLTSEEISLNVSYNPIISGVNPITANGGKSILPVDKDGIEFGRDAAGQILKDEFEQPVLVEGRDKELYINPQADLAVVGEDHLRTLSQVEAEGGNQTSATGRIIHPEAQKAFKSLITDGLSDSNAYITMNQLRYVDVRAIARLAKDDGSPSFTPDQVIRLSVMHSMSRNSATLEMLKTFQKNDLHSPKALTIAFKWMDSLHRGVRTDVTNSNEETIYGTGPDRTALATIANQVISFAAEYSGTNLDTYTTDNANMDKKEGNEGTSNESIVDFLDKNPQMKIMIARAYLAVLSDPAILRGGTGETDRLRSEQINDFMKTSFVPAEFEAADLSVINGVVIASKSLKSVERSVEGLDSIINSANLTESQKKEYMVLSAEAKRKIVAQGELQGTNGSKVLDTDTEQVVFDKQVTYIGYWTPSANQQVIGALLDGVGQTSVTRRGTTIAKNGLSDGELARIAMAANPEVYAAMNLVPNTPDAAAKVRVMSIEDQLKLATHAWRLIPAAEHWDMDLDFSDPQQLEGNNAGIPVGFSSIPVQITTGKGKTSINLIDSLTSKDNLNSNGAYMFRQRDNNNTPIVRIGQRIDVNGQLVENKERNGELILQDIIEAMAEGSKDNRETVLRGRGFPSRTDTGAINDVRAINAISRGEIQSDQTNFEKYFDTKGVDNPEVLSVVDLMTQLDLPKTKAALEFLRNLDPYFKDDAKGTSILDTITTDYRRATQPNTGELRTGSGEGKFNDALFTPAMMDAIVTKAKGLGLKTVSDHLSLLFAVAAHYRSNIESEWGYNMKEYRASTAQMFTEVRTNDEGEDQEIYPETILVGPKFGMILWAEDSSSFIPVLQRLIDEGSSIYTKKGTSEYYAFQTAPSSPDFELFHSAADQITPAVEATPDTMVTTTERTLAQPPLGGWDGWGPRYENVIKTTGNKGTPAQAAAKSTDLVKAFGKHRLRNIFLSEATIGNDIVESIDANAYIAEKEMVAIQSDISRILKSELRRLPGELTKIPAALAEIPAQLEKAIDEIPAQLEGQMDQAKTAVGAIPSQLAGQMDQAKNAGSFVELENWKQNTPVGAMENEKRRSANDFGRWVRGKMLDPQFAAYMAVYKEFGRDGNIDFTTSPNSFPANIALRAAFYSFFGMDEDVVNNLNHKQIVEIQKTIEAAPESKIKNITLTAVELLHKEHMETKQIDYIKPFVPAAPVSPGAIGDVKVIADVEEQTITISPVKFPIIFNKDGSVSNIKTISFSEKKGGPEILIPTIKGGKVFTEEEAIAEYKKTGEHFGIFSTIEKANTYAKQLHDNEELKIKSFENIWLNVIETYEGLELTAYNKDGKWTIGKGSTTHPDGTPVKAGDVINKQKADVYLKHFVYTQVIPTLKQKIPHWDKMNQNQQSALISFAYNMGPNFYGAKNRETITAALKSPLTWDKVPASLLLYNKATSQTSGKLVVLHGLVKRRKAEANLWNKTTQ